MRTLHPGFRVGDLGRSLRFYRALGYELIGEVPETGLGHLSVLKLPDDEFGSIELVSDPSGGMSVELGNAMTHLAIQVEDIRAVLASLQAAGFEVPEPTSPDAAEDFFTATVPDPDGRHLELVQWPPGHAAGLSAADWANHD